MADNLTAGAAFIASGTVTGASVSATVGGIGLVGGFGGIGIGMAPVTAAGGVVGAAAYGAFQAICEGDATAFGAVGIGAIGGIGVSSVIGGMGLSVGGTAVGIGMGTMAAAGGVVGLAAYGIAKLIDKAGSGETAAQAFTRMEEKVLWQEAYTEALLELELLSLESSLAEQIWQQKFAALEVEDELKQLKAQIQPKPTAYFNFNSSNSLLKKSAQFYNSGTSKSNSPSKESPSNFTEMNRKMVALQAKSPLKWCCIHTLRGHSSSVNSVAISGNGETFVSASNDKNVILWNLKTGEQIWTFFGFSQEVYSVAITPDGKTLITGDFEGKVTRWNLSKKELLSTLFYLNSPYSHLGLVYSVAFSPDGKTIVSGSADKTMRIWGGYTGEVKRTLNGHSDAVLSVAISPDSKTIVSGSADRTMRIWDLGSGKQIRILKGNSGWVNSIAISPDGEIIVSGSTDGKVNLWNLHTGELLETWVGHSAPIFSVAISPDGKTLASGSKNQVKIWNLSDRKLVQTLSGCYPVAFSADGQTLVSGGGWGKIKIWHLSIGSELASDSVLSGDWWEVLGLSQDATINEVKCAYRRLVRQYHPDVNCSANAKANMQAVVEAYNFFRKYYSTKSRS